MARFDFCGGSYTSQAVAFDCQRSVNLYPEINESGDGKSKMALYPTPGLKLLTTLEAAPRAQLEFNGRHFIVAGTKLYEGIATLDIHGSFVSLAMNVLNPATPIVNDFLPASMAANETQLLIASGGFVYVYYLATMTDSVTLLPVAAGTFVQVPISSFTLPSGNAPVIQVAFCDSFFLALIANSQTVCISDVLDGRNWDQNGQIVVSVYPDNIVSMIVDHREVWLLGRKKSVVYFSSGSLSVFDVAPGGYLEQGSGSTFGPALLDNSMLWVGGDDRGNAMAWRATGYSAQRISTHAIEFAWQGYPKISDCVSYSYQDQGHAFWVIFFPSANNFLGATWIYDTATSLWHERDFLNTTTGIAQGHPSWNHAFAFGIHIVGDWGSGKLFWQSINFFDNNGTNIIRLRRAPHIANEMQWQRYSQLELDMDVGQGWASDDATHAMNNIVQTPKVFMRFSDDSGKTWSNAQSASVGFQGQTKQRVVWRRLGRSRVRTFEITFSEATPFRIVDAYVRGSNQTASERLPHMLRKSA